MVVVRKFLFENDFDAGIRRQPGRSQAKASDGGGSAEQPMRTAVGGDETAMRAAIEVARQQGEEAGIAKGRAEANARHDRQATQALASLAGALGAIANAHLDALDVSSRAIEMGLAIARKLHPALAARAGMVEVEAVLAECLEALKKEPRLVAYVSPPVLDALRERLDPITAQAGFEGRVVLIGDPEMDGSDCRVEWADGGVERDGAQTWREIEAALDRYLDVTAASDSAAGDDDGR